MLCSSVANDQANLATRLVWRSWCWLLMIGATGWLMPLSTDAIAQVVQLPATRQLAYSGGIIVPDGGAAWLAGSAGAFGASNSSGSNRQLSTTGSAGNFSLSAHIIDLDALDQALLAAGPNSSSLQTASLPSGAIGGAASGIKRQLPTQQQEQDLKPLARGDYQDFQRTLRGPSELAQRTWPNPFHPELTVSNIQHYQKLVREAELAGRIQSARVYNRLALQHMTPELMSRYEQILRQRQKDEDADNADSSRSDTAGRRRF
ncbi:MAG: hypothetical protein KF752_09940 [Pirellulaceae bacterium]|nr:hypothetical protein [Pirellulaceae bacterium]